jgi:uracil-DNA glycosylase
MVSQSKSERAVARLVDEIRACRICHDHPQGKKLPHEPRPVLRVSHSARLAIFGQAPGTRVHQSGMPFTDPSGDRLRAWMGVSKDEFYDVTRVAIVPMGFCFPGLDAKGGDLPPRPECAKAWRARVLAELPNIELCLLVGSYSQAWHLKDRAGKTLTETVADWKSIRRKAIDGRRYFPLPHPSWRNNAWIKTNPWFERDLIPQLRRDVRAVLAEEG